MLKSQKEKPTVAEEVRPWASLPQQRAPAQAHFGPVCKPVHLGSYV